MAEQDATEEGGSRLHAALRRLGARRAPLAAGLAALLVSYLWAGSFAVLLAVAAAFTVATALMPERRGKRDGAVAPRPPEAEMLRERPGETLSAASLAAAVADPLIVFDAEGVVALANDAAREAFGTLDPGMPVMLKFRAPEMQEAIERVRSGEAPSAVVEFAERVPVERVFRVTASTVGRGTGLAVLSFKDQSESRRIERMRADFIANASHELRTPLASISGFVETLKGPARDDAGARDQFLAIMQNQTQRMARLIDDLLSLSRLEMKPYLPPSAVVDVRAVLLSVIESHAPLAAESGVAIETHLGDAPVPVHGDRDELFQVFENLVENACKYGQSGGRVTVSLERASRPEPEVRVTVRDFGPGIPAEHIPRITERFYRVDMAASRAQKGTGLGLAIVKHILGRHKGRLSIRSEIGQGAAFTVHLPTNGNG
jgi:two-component system phosphate regulon sensor histidine kinase PhoR